MLRWIVACLMVGCAPSILAESKDQDELGRFTFTEYHMGINARLDVYAPSREVAETACEAAFKRIAELEAIMSDYRPDSELMRLCAQSGGPPVRVSEDLFRVLWRAQTVAKQSDGAFDVTVGPLVQLWRKARRETKLPAKGEVESAKKLVGWRKMRMDARTRSVRLATPGMRLDLGGIAKGYASDEALKTLRKHGVKRALVEMGGDIVLGDAPPQTEGWRISVPNAARPGQAAEMTLKNCAISTSGDTEQFVVIEGVRYSHVVDPKTGYGLSHRVQATILAKDGFTSDPLSTTLTLLGERRRAALLRRYPSTKAFVKVAPTDEP
jgi:thiamine biosynthesis lipoprotein